MATLYVKVENGVITWGPSELPQSYTFPDGSTTGNFNLMDEDVIVEQGFLPLVSNIPTFDSKYQVAKANEPIIDTDSVVYNWTVSDIDINALKGQKKAEVNQVMQSVLYSSVLELNGHEFTMTKDTMLLVSNMANQANIVGSSWSGVLQADNGDFVEFSASDILELNQMGQTKLSEIMQSAAGQVSNINNLTSSKDVAYYQIVIS